MSDTLSERLASFQREVKAHEETLTHGLQGAADRVNELFAARAERMNEARAELEDAQNALHHALARMNNATSRIIELEAQANSEGTTLAADLLTMKHSNTPKAERVSTRAPVHCRLSAANDNP